MSEKDVLRDTAKVARTENLTDGAMSGDARAVDGVSKSPSYSSAVWPSDGIMTGDWREEDEC